MPDWRGQVVVVVASGPSAKDVPLSLGKGRAKFIAINNSVLLAPWADCLYACDWKWWRKHRWLWEGAKCPLLVSQDRIAVEVFPRIKRVNAKRACEALQFAAMGEICWAGNSGLQAVNLAAQWGASRIVLVGFDMRLDHGAHWHGKHRTGMSNPSDKSVARWLARTEAAAAVLATRGIDVVNCSPISALTSYRKTDFASALVLNPVELHSAA